MCRSICFNTHSFSLTAYFISITQALLNLNFVQALVLITYQMPHEQRMDICSKASLTDSNMPKSFDTISDYIAFIMNSTDGKPNSLKSTTCTVSENVSYIYNYLKNKFLHSFFCSNAASAMTSFYLQLQRLVYPFYALPLYCTTFCISSQRFLSTNLLPTVVLP